MKVETLQFGQVLNAALTPLFLISGVGLILLSLVNRYNHALDRIRQLHGVSFQKIEVNSKIFLQIEQLYRRCRLLKASVGCISLTIVFSSLIVFFSLLQFFIPVRFDYLQIIFLFLAVTTLVISAILLFLDVNLSLRAIDIELGKRK